MKDSDSGRALPRRVLIVESDMTGKKDVLKLFDGNEIRYTIVSDLSSMLYSLNNQSVEVAIIANEFLELPGMAIAQKIRAQKNAAKAASGIILTTHARELKSEEVFLQQELGGIEVLKYPFPPPQIFPYLTRAMRYREETIAYDELNNKFISFFRKTGRADQAVEQVKKNLGRLGKRGPFLLLDLYEECGDFESELTLVNSLLERTGEQDIRLINRKGSCLMRLNRMEEARKYLEKADQLAPKNIERMDKMIDMYIQTNEPEKSVQMGRQVISLKPEDEGAKFSIYNKLIDAGFAKHARDLCRETTMPEEIVRYYNNKGVAAAKVGNIDEAMKLYEQALFFYPKSKANYKIHFNIALAEIHRKGENYLQSALAAVDRCLELSPDYEKAQRIKEKLEKMLERMSSKVRKDTAA